MLITGILGTFLDFAPKANASLASLCSQSWWRRKLYSFPACTLLSLVDSLWPLTSVKTLARKDSTSKVVVVLVMIMMMMMTANIYLVSHD